MSYDPIFRERALKHEEAHGIGKTCESFGISTTAIKSWRKQYLETGSLEKKPLNRKHKKIDPEMLLKDVRDYPDSFNRERAERFGCSAEAIRKALKRLGVTLKKNFYLRGEGRGKTAAVPRPAACDSPKQAGVRGRERHT